MVGCVIAVALRSALAFRLTNSICGLVAAAEAEDSEGKRKAEAMWPIFRIHHQRSRYIYEMFYKVSCKTWARRERERERERE
jgi:hypothetical protein